MQNRRKYLPILIWGFIILVLVGLVVWAAYLRQVRLYSWADWTGIGSYTSPGGAYIRSKTLWDWVELLLAPLAIVLSALLFFRAHRKLTLGISSKQNAVAQELARRERHKDRDIASEQRRVEKETANAPRLDMLIREYITKIEDLLMHEGLREAKEDPEFTRQGGGPGPHGRHAAAAGRRTLLRAAAFPAQLRACPIPCWWVLPCRT